MVGPSRPLRGIRGSALFFILLAVSALLAALLILSALQPTLTSRPASGAPGAINQPLQAGRQTRPQPNYLDHPDKGQAYLHKLLVRSAGDFDRLNAGDKAFVGAVMGGHARRYFSLMYRGMTSKANPGVASSKHGRSNNTN